MMEVSMNSKVTKRTRRLFTPEFKAEAVRLVREPGKPVVRVARELDLTATCLRAWVTASGDLLVRYRSGVARVDLATGSLAARRCGWSCGISDTLFRDGPAGPIALQVRALAAS
jgi:hypothetical protein